MSETKDQFSTHNTEFRKENNVLGSNRKLIYIIEIIYKLVSWYYYMDERFLSLIS